jgi:asparagine synthase (glutamine-hydrolysing)
LPGGIHALPKRGFSVPAARWLREDLRPLAETAVNASDGLAADVLKRSVVERLWREHASGARDHSAFLWGLVMLGLWERATAP